MALYPAPLTAILGAIAAQNKGVTLDPSLYTFGAPTPYADPQGATNTSMLITVAEVTAPYQGSQTVYYKRLNLSDLAQLLPMPIQCNGIATVADFWALLNANFGLNFVAGDLNDSTAVTVGSDGSGSVTLIAQANSLGWIGQVTMTFIAGNYNLANVVTGTALAGLMYPNQDLTKPFGELYSYWRDMTAWQTDLQKIQVGQTDLTTLTNDLKACTGDAWTNTAAARYSLQGASVVYNGTTKAFVPIAGTVMTPNVNGYTYVLVVQLSATSSLQYGGYLFLHYGAIDQFANTDGTASKTALLLHFDGINNSQVFVDNTGKAVSFSDAVISSTYSMWGGSSWFWNGKADAYISVPDSAALEFTAAEDMTVEGWFYPLNNTQSSVLWSKSTSGGAAQLAYNAGTLAFSTDQTTGNISVATALLLNQWNHVAIVKKSGTWTLYVNGTPVGADAAHLTDTFGVNASAFMLGNNAGLASAFQGYIDEFRVSTVARYSATFTVPSDPFVVD
jgi:hypothetical protein